VEIKQEHKLKNPSFKQSHKTKMKEAGGKSRSSLNRLPQVQLIFIRASTPSRAELVLEFSPDKRN